MRLRAASLALLLSASAALADGVSIPGVPSAGGKPVVGFIRGGGGGGGLTYTPFTSPACYNGSYITNISIPGVGVGRGVIWFAVSIGFDNGTQRNFSAITLGGQAPTGEIAQNFGGGMWWYDNTAGTIPGTTATLNFTVPGNETACASSGLVSGASSPTPTIFTSGGNSGVAQPFTHLPITVAAGGFGIAAIAIEVNSPTTVLPLVWTSATRDAGTEQYADPADNSGNAIGSAHLTASATPTVACGGTTCSFLGYTTMAASWR